MNKFEYQFSNENGDKSGWVDSNRLMDIAFIGDIPHIKNMQPGQSFVDCDGDVWECREMTE